MPDAVVALSESGHPVAVSTRSNEVGFVPLIGSLRAVRAPNREPDLNIPIGKHLGRSPGVRGRAGSAATDMGGGV